MTYIGQTRRCLETRVKEHKAAARLRHLEKSPVAEHTWQPKHKAEWKNARIVDKEIKTAVQLVKEAIHIWLHLMLNKKRDAGINVSKCWSATLKKLLLLHRVHYGV